MRVELISTPNNWTQVVNACRTTVGKEAITKEPSTKFKNEVLRSEHSPIRLLQFHWKWIGIPYWVSVHLVRHKYGIEHYVRTQRTDRTGINRDEIPQGALVEHECVANAQAIINISRKRLCNQASKETREAWKLFLDEIKQIEPELYNACVPECIYRNGLCPEFNCCGVNQSKWFEQELENYRNLR